MIQRVTGLAWLMAIGGATAVAACNAQAPATEFDGQMAMQRVERQLAFGPRIPGSEGHRQTGDWLDSLLRQLADTVVVQTWPHVTQAGDTLPMRNLIARFHPAATERVLYAAHWDTQPFATGPNSPDSSAATPGANNNAGGVALLLGVADALAQQPLQTIGVDLLFTDGEDLGDFDRMRDVLVGSRYYGQHQVADDPPLFAIVFDMIADADLQIYQEGNSTRAAPEVVDRVWRSARDLGYEQYFIPDIEHYIIDDHRALLEAGIRAILLIDFDYPYWDSTEDTIDKVSAASLTIVGNTAIRVLRAADR